MKLFLTSCYIQAPTMTNVDDASRLDCGLKCREIDTKGFQIHSLRHKGMILLAVTSAAALIAVTNPNVVSRMLHRKIFLKNVGYSTSAEIRKNSQAFDTMKTRKHALRHESNRVAGRKRVLKLSDYSDPKSMDEKATSTATDTFGTNNEVLYQGSNQIDTDGALSTGTYPTSGNFKQMEQQQQQSLSQPTMRLDGATTLDATVDDNSPSNYATGNAPDVEMQQWQPALQETIQKQQQALGGELVDGGMPTMSTRYANSEYEIDGEATARTVSLKTASSTPDQQTNYELLESQQQPSNLGETPSETNSYGDTSMKMETQQQWQQQQQPAFSGSMQSATKGDSLMSIVESEQQTVQEAKTSVVPLPTEEGMIANKTPFKVNDRFSSPTHVESTQDSPMQQWPSNQEGSQRPPIDKTDTETITPVSSKPDFISTVDNGKIVTDGDSLKMPSSFDNIANFPSSMEPGDIAVLWNIPKGGNTAINDILAGCLQLVVANNVGAQFGHASDQNLQVFEQHGARFVNVETFTLDGLSKAKRLHLTSSGLVDAMVVYYVHEASELFTRTHRGFFFTMMRDPIERTLLLIRSKRDDPAFSSMSIRDFARSGVLSTNWMTRWLSNQPTGPLSEEHLKFAKNILRTKFVIGIYEKMEKSLEHFEKYFGWKVLSNSHREKCVRDHISDDVQNNDVSMDIPSKDSNEYKMLLDLNHFDIELYRYAKILFMEQAGHFGKIPRPIFGQ